VPPAVDGILKLVFAKELTCGVPESATESARASWNGARDMSCASFGVSYTSARALDVEQMTWVAELVAGNIDVQAHTSRVHVGV
jgi:hypothetical protein